MHTRIVPLPNARLLGAIALSSGLVACEPLVDVNVKLIEPCNQSGTALSGVGTYQVSHDGPGATNAVLLTKSGASEPLVMHEVAEDVIVTVQGYVGDVGQDPAVTNGAPQAIGRTLPLDITGTAPDLDVVMPMGLVDSFGQATDAEGACTFSQNGEAIPGRHGHTATYLPDQNKVLIFGGAVWTEANGVRGEALLSSAELFDPVTGTFELLPASDLVKARGYHTATALPDGRVLIAGGFGIINGEIQALTNGLLYTPDDPSGDPWVSVTFRVQRALHTATLLAEQQLVLLIGGCAGEGCRPQGATDPGDGDPTAAPKLANSIAVYDIANDEVIAQPNVMVTTRAMHAASALEGGRVLVSGGVNASGVVCDIEVFQTNGTSVSSLAAPGEATFSACPAGHTQVTLSDSRVMFIGGQTAAPGGIPGGPGVSTVQFWNTTVGIETLTAAMLSGRANHASTLLADGSVLVVGGTVAAGGATAERLVPQGETYMHQALAGTPLQSARARLAIAPLPNNQVVVVGGQIDLPAGAGTVSSDLVEIYYGR